MPKPSRRTRSAKRPAPAPAQSRRVAEQTVVYRPGTRGRTDWARVDRTTDEEIRKQIAADPDVAPEVDESWMADAEIVLPGKKEGIYLRLDPDVIRFFRKTGRGYQTRINAVLRTYVRAARGGKR